MTYVVIIKYMDDTKSYYHVQAASSGEAISLVSAYLTADEEAGSEVNSFIGITARESFEVES